MRGPGQPRGSPAGVAYDYDNGEVKVAPLCCDHPEQAADTCEDCNSDEDEDNHA